MNNSLSTANAVLSTKSNLSTSKSFATTPPDSPLPFDQQGPATPPLPASPPTTVSVDPSPGPSHAFDTLSRPVRTILHIIRRCYEGILDDSDISWKGFTLNQEEYDVLQNALDRDERLKGWVGDKLRFDYDSLRGEIVLRMPSQVHCVFARGLDGAIADRINHLREDGQQEIQGGQREINQVVAKIKVDSTSDIRFPGNGNRDRKSPDSSFSFEGYKYPTVVIEVANSQQKKELQRLAEFYINHSKGRIKTVITVDIEYHRPRYPSAPLGREATYSVYRHRVIRSHDTGQVSHREAHPDPESQCFRTPDLSVIDGALELRLSDFCPPGILSDSNDIPIHIPHQTLAGLLAEGERRQVEAVASSDDDDRSELDVPFVSKRKRSSTPKLTAEHEALFQVAEAEDETRALEKDSSFEAAPSFSSVEDALPQRTKKIKTTSAPDQDS